MDAKQFLEAVKPVLKARLEQYSVEIKRDNLPTSVMFLVISPAFEGMSRWARIEFMASVVEETFGLPLEFGPSGVALTPKEAADNPWPEDDSADWDITSDTDDSAARPLSES